MTLIIGRRFSDLVYLIADTASAVPMTNEHFSAIATPICKILAYRDVAIAYAGNTYYLPDIKNIRDSVDSVSALTAKLTSINRDSNASIEFLLIDLNTLSLTRISEGRAEDLQAGYIGSHDAFEVLQKERGLAAETVSVFFGASLPECSEEHGKLYVADLMAFIRTLQAEGKDVGGVAFRFLPARRSILSAYTFHRHDVPWLGMRCLQIFPAQ